LAWTTFSRRFANPHSDGYSIARRFRTSGHARRRTSASYSGDRQKNRAGWTRILYCETIFHRDVPRNCAQVSPRIDSRANLFSNAAISYQRKWRNSSSVKLASRHQGRLVGFGIAQGHMATLLVDDVKTGLFQRSHQFSCTRLPEVGSEGRQEWRLPLPGRGWARPAVLEVNEGGPPQ
jgi:hypothetical protein